MGSGLKLRRIRNNEVKHCAKIIVESDPWTTLGWTEKGAAKAIRDGMRVGEVAVAVKGEDVAGFIVFLPKWGFPLGGYVRLLAVNEKCRGMGIGKILLEKA